MVDLKFFEYKHLAPHLQDVSQKFNELAHWIDSHPELGGPEKTVALRKLLESKDAAVRARI